MPKSYQPKHRPDGSLNPRYRNRGGHVKPFRFVAWDGEGVTLPSGEHIYTILANSEGDSLIRPDGIRTHEALDFLTEKAATLKNVRHVGFVFSYDANMCLKDLDYATIQRIWNEPGQLYAPAGLFKVAYRPRKYLKIQRPRWHHKNGKWCADLTQKITLWDAFGFFQSSFVEAVEKWLGKDYELLPQIKAGKRERSRFTQAELESVILPYCQAECRALVDLMDRLRAGLKEANLSVHRWDGAGAIAASLMQRHGIKDKLEESPPEVSTAVQHAYFGGRMELALQGITKNRVYHYDLNSAYPAGLLHVPTLKGGRWKLEDDHREPFSLSLVSWQDSGAAQLHPFPYRNPLGSVYFPRDGSSLFRSIEPALEREIAVEQWRNMYREIMPTGIQPLNREDYPVPRALIRKNGLPLDVVAAGQGYDYMEDFALLLAQLYADYKAPKRVQWDDLDGWARGWYWEPEIMAAETVGLDSFTIEATWNFYPATDARPYDFLPALFAQRAKWKRAGNPAEKVLKLGINSLYGKHAQQVGQERPPYHCLEYAGYTTSWARAQLFLAAMQHPAGVVMLATDGIYSLDRVELDEGDGLGQWEASTHDGLTAIQSGVYWLDNDPKKIFCRGYDKDAGALSLYAVQDALRAGRESITVPSTRFLTMGSALSSPQRFGEWCRWLTVNRKLDLAMTTGKRVRTGRVHPSGLLETRAAMIEDNDGMSAAYPCKWAGSEFSDALIDGVNEKIFSMEVFESGGG